MDVNVLLAEEVRIDSIFFRIRSHPRQSSCHGLLHHFAQMSGRRELLSAAHPARFDEHDVAAHWRPHQAHCHAGLLHALVDFSFRAELGYAKEFPHDFGSHNHFFRVAFRKTPCLFARDGSNLAFQVAHTGFSRKAMNNFLQAFLGEFNLFAKFYAVFSGLLRDQVFVRNVDLLFASVARQFDDLHAIAQRLRNWIHPVCGGNKNHLRQIERHVQVMITER